MILKPSTWIHRRVESITYATNGETRRRVSVDLTIPSEYRQTLRDGDRVLLPLAIIAKEPLVRFDMRDAEGCALPVLETQANGRVAERVLKTLVLGAFGSDSVDGAELGSRVRKVVYAGRTEANEAVTSLRQYLHPGADEYEKQLVLQLAVDLAHGFLLVVETARDSLGRRVIVKYEYEDSIALSGRAGPAFRPVRVQIDRPAVGDANSYHLEVRAPDGIATKALKLAGEGLGSEEVFFLGKGPIVHGHLNAQKADFGAQVLLVPERRGTVTWAAVSSICVMTGFAACAVFWPPLHTFLSDTAERGTSLATVLLALPAFLLVLLGRSPEHFLVSRVLRPARWIVLLTALLMLGGATVLIVVPPLSRGGWVFWSLASAQFFLAALACRIWLVSDPGPIISKSDRAGGTA